MRWAHSIFISARHGSNYFHLFGNNRCAHCSQKILSGVGPKIKGARMICIILMRLAKSLLTFTSNTCKCEFLLTVLMSTHTFHSLVSFMCARVFNFTFKALAVTVLASMLQLRTPQGVLNFGTCR